MNEGPHQRCIEWLRDDLADVARETARLLLQPCHDEADLEALDIRAAALRRRIAEAESRLRAPEPVELRRPGGGAPLVSGG
jgi:hypothetical protein